MAAETKKLTANIGELKRNSLFEIFQNKARFITKAQGAPAFLIHMNFVD